MLQHLVSEYYLVCQFVFMSCWVILHVRTFLKNQ